MKLSSKKLDFLALAMLVLLLFPACKKSEEVANPDDLPDLNKQIRPYVTVENTRVRSGPGQQ
jgi:hypothetical protein